MTQPLHILVTGATAGIGRATSVALARAGHSVTIANRSVDKARGVLEELRAIAAPGATMESVALDLADLASVRNCADGFITRGEPLQVVIANAGLAGQRGATKDGFELAFGTNHLGHFSLVNRLLPLLERGAASSIGGRARVVVVASRAHYRPKAIDWEALQRPTQSFSGFPEYGVSKLCNVLFAAELSRRVAERNIDTYALDPGVVASDIWRRIPQPFRWLAHLRMLTNEEGARTSVFCATSPEVTRKTGLYWFECAEKNPSRLSRDETLARELWDRSESWVANNSR